MPALVWQRLEAFARQGALVGLNARKAPVGFEQVLEAMKAEGGNAILFSRRTCRKRRTCEQLIADFVTRFGGIDVLINNAGGLVGRKPVAEIDDAFFADVINLNVRSAQMLTRFALPHLKASAGPAAKPVQSSWSARWLRIWRRLPAPLRRRQGLVAQC